MWILTESFNDYNQHGDVFVSAWRKRPSDSQLKNEMKALGYEYTDEMIAHLQAGGGRVKWEDSWYNLFEYQPRTNSL
jgi:hypothetical protein